MFSFPLCARSCRTTDDHSTMIAALVTATLSWAAPTRLRASGSDWSSNEVSLRFALTHESRPLFTWAPSAAERGARQSAYSVEVMDARGMPVWRSGKVASAQSSARYPASAPPLSPAATYEYSVTCYDGAGTPSPSARSAFHVAAAPSDWHNVSWLGDDNLNLYRTRFTLGADVLAALTSAHLYVAGLGYAVVTIDGAPLNTLTTAPWTNNARVVGFSTYNITAALSTRSGATEGMSHESTHEMAIELGHGWRDLKAFPVRDPADAKRFGQFERTVRAKLVATLADGSKRTITHTGDGTWSAAKGPTTYDSV